MHEDTGFDLLAVFGDWSVRVGSEVAQLSLYRRRLFQRKLTKPITCFRVMPHTLVLYFEDDRIQFERNLLSQVCHLVSWDSSNATRLEQIQQKLAS